MSSHLDLLAFVAARARTQSRTSSSTSHVTLRMAAVVHFGFSEQIEQSFLLARIQSPRHLRRLTPAL